MCGYCMQIHHYTTTAHQIHFPSSHLVCVCACVKSQNEKRKRKRLSGISFCWLLSGNKTETIWRNELWSPKPWAIVHENRMEMQFIMPSVNGLLLVRGSRNVELKPPLRSYTYDVFNTSRAPSVNLPIISSTNKTYIKTKSTSLDFYRNKSVSTRIPSSSSRYHCCSLTIHFRRKGLNHIFCLFLLSALKPTSRLPFAMNPSLDQCRHAWRATSQRRRKKKWAEMALSVIYWYFASRKTRLKISHTTSRWELTSSRAMG